MTSLSLLLSLFACSTTPTASATSCGAERGTILDIDRGDVYSSLDEVRWANSTSYRLCLGAGKHSVEGPLLALDSDQVDPPTIALYGAGADRTVLVPTHPTGLRVVAHGELTLSGLSFHGGADLIGGDVTLTDVAVHGVNDPTLAGLLAVYADSVDIFDLELRNNLIERNLFYVTGHSEESPITIDGLRVFDNRATEMSNMVIGQGNVWLHDVELFSNEDIQTNETGHFFTTWGTVYASDVSIYDNTVNGPALTIGDSFEADNLEITDHVSPWASTLYVAAPTRLRSPVLRRNDSPSGAIGLYRSSEDVGSIWLTDADLGGGVWDNTPCDVSWRGYCLESDIDVVEELVCDEHGCR